MSIDALEETVKRILQRLFPQPDETESVVLEMRHGMAQFLLEIADDEEPHADAVADLNDVAIASVEERELQHDHLRDAALDDDIFERL